MPQDLDFNQLNTLIKSANAGWQAGPTSVSDLSPDDQKTRLGYVPDGGEESLEQRIQASAAKLSSIQASAMGAAAAFDWRNVNGQNYVTPIRNQGGCGSCVSFGTTAAVESAIRIQRGDPGLAVDLSEAILFFCIG